MSTYQELLKHARVQLKHQNIPDADLDAWYLMSFVFQINRTYLLLNGDLQAPEEGKEEYLRLVAKRAAHIPLQHLTGVQEFMGLEFEVNQDVLIPRQDTELLVEAVLKECAGKAVLDMCTGSGCIIVSLAKHSNLKKAVGVDVSVKALNVAERNALRNGVEIEYLQSNLFERVEGYYDIIVSNPPYIPTKDIDSLMPEVKEHEPVLALDGSEDGLEFYRSIASSSAEHLKTGGLLFLEIGHDQGEAVWDILFKKGFSEIIVKKDLSGHDRVVSAVRL